MNRKYDNTSAQKAISFKTATVVVISLHLVGFFGITQWSAYKTKLSREKRQEEYAKRMELAKTEKFNWPEGKAKIVATSPTPKPTSTITSNQTSNIGFFDKIISFFSSKPEALATKPAIIVNNDSSQKDEDYNKKVAEIATLIEHATARLSKKANELASLEFSLKQKQKLIDERAKKQQKAAVAVSETISRPTTVRSTHLPRSTTKQTAPSSPTVISPETVRTYTKNGIQYIDVVETSKILSSHIILN